MDGQPFSNLRFNLRSLVLRSYKLSPLWVTLFEVQFEVNSTVEMNQPQWYKWPQIKNLENNCDNFWKFLKTLKTNVGFHFTRLVVWVNVRSLSGKSKIQAQLPVALKSTFSHLFANLLSQSFTDRNLGSKFVYRWRPIIVDIHVGW